MTIRFILATVALCALSGCATKPEAKPAIKTARSATAPHAPAPMPHGRSVQILDGHSGAPLAWGALLSAAAGADVVVIGENHGHPLGLAFAAALWEDLLARPDAGRAALSMEFFERDQQVALDAYLAGIADERGFKRATGKTTDAAYPPGHRAMIEAAKAKGVPVIAANAPRIYVSYAGKQPYEKLAALPEEHRRLFRIPGSLPIGRYRADYNAIMDMPHGMPGAETKPETPEQKAARLDNGFRAQSLWDWTMADSILRAVNAGRAPVVHVVGRFHSDFRGGLIEAISAIRPATRIVTISTIDAAASSLRPDDTGRADFVVYVGPFPEETRPQKVFQSRNREGAAASPERQRAGLVPAAAPVHSLTHGGRSNPPPALPPRGTLSPRRSACRH